mmetsp:Transcript_45935/g.153306  ORF Transcript_45935/g.153306 Transcript_45935/m.153306 type:complete len:94 (+) Transcript_45935:2236-2517(+)
MPPLLLPLPLLLLPLLPPLLPLLPLLLLLALLLLLLLRQWLRCSLGAYRYGIPVAWRAYLTHGGVAFGLSIDRQESGPSDMSRLNAVCSRPGI